MYASFTREDKEVILKINFTFLLVFTLPVYCISEGFKARLEAIIS